MEWNDVLTALLATYGAGLSTYIALADRQKNKPKVRVTLQLGMLEQVGRDLSDWHLFITAMNIGEKTVTLSYSFLKLPTGQTIIFPHIAANMQFPYELQPGKNCVVGVDTTLVAETLRQSRFEGIVEITGGCRDQTDEVYLSKPLKIDLKQWREQQVA